ncbi:PACE efflux transporter [Burkholderia latens]|uniref:Membrane protein n=1 Tax=Burkholderia latens TaxID=488446 RepID=A0A6H9TJT4_9BURK|nr:PACE efflux transporter [Burkholderia latens]KAB0644066.1 PACE efflux transporter [Burkholderia latens]VWB04893.1 membrane protein [Burkholderia latens]
MQGLPRRIMQAVLYEAIAVFCISPVIAALFKQGLVYSGALSVTMSAIAMLWNMIFNALFERWEASRRQPRRTLARRILHATGFEGGLIFILVPVVSWWLDISWFDALVVDVGLFTFFFCYAFVFQWAFDRVFDVPAATKRSGNRPDHAPADNFGNCQP